MAQVYVCDICGMVNPRSIRRIIAKNPDVSDKPLNCEKYYAFNLFSGDFCEDCLHKIERAISLKIYEMKEESKSGRNGAKYE